MVKYKAWDLILGQLRENQVFSMKTSFKISVLASGSRGNASLIQVGQTAILIDAGISCRRIVQGLKARNLLPSDLGGIFLTHEHKDHIAGLEVFHEPLERFPSLPVKRPGPVFLFAVP